MRVKWVITYAFVSKGTLIKELYAMQWALYYFILLVYDMTRRVGVRLQGFKKKIKLL